MNEEKRQITYHEQDNVAYPSKDLNKYKELINMYQAEDQEIGRDAVTAPDLSKLTSESNEMFRKILNGQKTTKKRDYIIMIGILLRMDSDTINMLLASLVYHRYLAGESGITKLKRYSAGYY